MASSRRGLLAVELEWTPTLTAAERRLLALPEKLQNLRPLMKEQIWPVTREMLERHWSTKGAAFGHRWAPWADSTRARRVAQGNAAKGLLRDTDNLFRKIFRERAVDTRLQEVRGGLRLRLDSRVRYAVYHQVGTSFMPERQIIPYPFPRNFIIAIRKIIKAYLRA